MYEKESAVLLYGMPGMGKSSFAKGLVHYLHYTEIFRAGIVYVNVGNILYMEMLRERFIDVILKK